MASEAETVENREATLDRIMRELGAGINDLPTVAIRDAQKHRDQIIPRLIQAIQDATAKAASGEIPEGNAHYFALFLLTEFEAKESLPAIVEAISLPGELPFELFGDTITETLARVLAVMAGETPELLDDLIRNRSLNEYVRWAAAGTYLFLVRDGRLTRDEAVDRLHGHLREGIANKDTEIVSALIMELVSFSPHEALDEIKEAFRLELVDESMVDLKGVELSVSHGESRFQKEVEYRRPYRIQDTVEELESWYAFANDDEPVFTPEMFDELLAADWALEEEPRNLDTAVEEIWQPPISICNTQPRVGRNDRCPCGSGRKFKKCCGTR